MLHFEHVIKYTMLLNSHIILLGRSMHLYCFFVYLQVTVVNFLSNGQYVHLPSVVQILRILVLTSCGCSGKSISALVNISLRLGNLLYPKIGGLGNKCPQSWLWI